MTACGGKKSSPEVIPKISNEVTEANYLNGKAFCNKYSKITSQQHGKFIEVPVDYNNPDKGTIEIYTWTNKPFNPNVKSFIYLNGGPGGNSHGNSNFLKTPENIFPGLQSNHDNWNEIHFDQRGLGCSAPRTFKEYKNQELYSSINTALDMESIRKSYQIQEWTVFGISYGTVPATIYASKFPLSTTALVVEGIISTTPELDDSDFNADKSNQILAALNSAQKNNFRKLYKDKRYREILTNLMSVAIYMDGGYKIFKERLNELITPDGQIHYNLLHAIESRLQEYQQAQFAPQAPGAVDSNVYLMIFCKEMNSSSWRKLTEFDEDSLKFYTRTIEDRRGNYSECTELGITKRKVKNYVAADYPVTKHVTYFQGTHDGATPMVGAITHWMNVPKSTSQMLAKTRGGHTPLTNGLQYVEDDDMTDYEKQKAKNIVGFSQEIFILALNGQKISDNLIYNLNQQIPFDEQWLSPEKSSVGLDKIKDASRLVNRQKKFEL